MSRIEKHAMRETRLSKRSKIYFYTGYVAILSQATRPTARDNERWLCALKLILTLTLTFIILSAKH